LAQQPAASGSGDIEKRIHDLEETVRQLKAEQQSKPPTASTPVRPASAQETDVATPQANTPPSSPAGALVGQTPEMPQNTASSTPILAGWDDTRGFFIRSADDRFHFRVTGQLQADYRAFLDGRDYTDVDSFLVRRARLGIEADMFQYYEFRLLPDFSNAQGPGVFASTRLQDAYINIHYWNALQIEAGKFKQPVSYEQLIQDRFVPTAERSIIDQLVPARDEGIMLHGERIFGDRFDWAIAVSNGEINGDYDSNKLKDVNGRIAIRSFNNIDELPQLFWLLQVGISGGTGDEAETINPNPLRTPATVPWFKFNSAVVENGRRDRWTPELVYFYGPFGFAAQYYREIEHLSPTFAGPGSHYVLEVPYTGFYIMSTYLLTGESRTTYSAPVVPFHNYNPCRPWACSGAWELVGRVSRLNVDGDVFEHLKTGKTSYVTLASPAGNSQGATEMTLGFNWYLNAWVRMQFNWEHAWFDDPVRLGPGPDGLLRHQDSLLTRLQVIF
jgi:phosphate-selective porin OprO/OprP